MTRTLFNKMTNRTEYNKAYREKNREKLLEYSKQYYKNNKEKCDEYKKKWAEGNPDRRKESLEKHNQKIRDYRESTIEAFLDKVLSRIQDKPRRCHKSAKEKYEQCDLTIECLVDLWNKQDGKCALTNKKMVHKFKSLFTVSVDRIDSSKGYMKDNIQLVCQAVNYAKNCFSNEQFLHFWNSNEE